MARIRGGWVMAILMMTTTVVVAAEDSGVTSSQPMDDRQTFISVMVLEFTPKSPNVTPRAIRRKLRSASSSTDIRKLLDKLGETEIVSRPCLLVQWPNRATITMGERVPVLKDGSLGYENVGLKLAIDGEWLRIDDERAYVRASIEHSYLDRPATTSQPERSIARKEFLKEQILTAHKRHWMVLPLEDSEQSGRVCLVGLELHRL